MMPRSRTQARVAQRHSLRIASIGLAIQLSCVLTGTSALADAITIVAFGDSTTAPRETVERVYAQRLPDLLATRGIDAEVINSGLGGNHTGRAADNGRFKIPHATERFDSAVREHKPDIVIIQFGWNDSWVDEGGRNGTSRIPLANYKANLTGFVRTLQQDGARVIVMTPNEPKADIDPWRYERTHQYAEAVCEIAEAERVHLVDVWQSYHDYRSEPGRDVSDLLLDMVHPNDDGHALVANMLADTIAGMAAGDDGTDASAFHQEDLFTAGQDGVAIYRIPSLVVTIDGTLLAVCDARVKHGGDLPNNIDQAIRRSTDNGKTWSPIEIIIDYPGEEGAGDPCMLVDRNTGRVWLLVTYGDNVGWKQSRPGYGKNTLHILSTYSDDDGLSWSRPKDITRQVKKPEWNAMWTSPGIGVQWSRGRLLVGCSVHDENKQVASYQMFSDDHGETWSISEACGMDTNENQTVELADSTLMVNMRSTHGKGCRAVAESTDGGITWTGFRHDEQLPEPVCQASFIRYPNDADTRERNWLLFANPARSKSGDRREMTVRLSQDGGRTWPISRLVHAGPAAYSCMAILSDGSVGLLYERGDGSAYEKITFARFPLAWLMGDSSRPTQ